MDLKTKTYLFDILKCKDELEYFFQGEEITLETLTEELVRARAVERVLEIIGEATKNLLKIDPDISISSSRRIIATRNFIAHEYGIISYENVVEILKNHLPILKHEVEELLAQE